MEDNLLNNGIAFVNSAPGGTVENINYVDFLSITTNGPGRNDADPGSWDKFKIGDRIEPLNFDNFLKPNGGGTGALSKGFNKFRDVLGNLANSVGYEKDLVDQVIKPKIDTISIQDYTFKKGSGIPIDTMYKTPIKNNETSVSAIERLLKEIDSVKSSK